jgi:hypothetical protein
MLPSYSLVMMRCIGRRPSTKLRLHAEMQKLSGLDKIISENSSNAMPNKRDKIKHMLIQSKILKLSTK